MATKSDQTMFLSEPDTPQILLVDIPGVGKKYVKMLTVNSTSEQTTAQFGEPNEIVRQQTPSLPTLAGPSRNFTIDEDISHLDLLSSPRSLTGAKHGPAASVTQMKQLIENWSVESEHDSDSGD